jgi:8-oxo-dGTP pyrophosphatase MutT (NUDIX family)
MLTRVALRAIFQMLCYTLIMKKTDLALLLPALHAQLEPLNQVPSSFSLLLQDHPQARQAAVLLCLYAQDGDLFLLFIKRAQNLRAHSGEIAFPGGSCDPTDTSLVATALREAHEEIGLDSIRVEVLGLLPPVFTFVSNFLMAPVVAYLPTGPGNLQLQSSEVAEILPVSLRKLSDPELFHIEYWGANRHPVHFYDYGSHRIWGATGRIVYELLSLL